jgi:hypothetical protein
MRLSVNVFDTYKRNCPVCREDMLSATSWKSLQDLPFAVLQFMLIASPNLSALIVNALFAKRHNVPARRLPRKHAPAEAGDLEGGILLPTFYRQFVLVKYYRLTVESKLV